MKIMKKISPYIKYLIIIIAILLALFVTACNMTLPIKGHIQGIPGTFVGTVKLHMDQTGYVRVTLGDGVNCSGKFSYTIRKKGRGSFECDNGRTGPFTFALDGKRATGSGTFDNRLLTFGIGK